MTNFQYNKSLLSYKKIDTTTVNVGQIMVGGQHPIRLQSMTSTDTNDTEATVQQVIAIVDAGGEYVRITAPGIKEAEQLGVIKNELQKRGYKTPLVADIHFNPKAAEVAATLIEKVRINPGNYVDRKGGDSLHYSDEEYAFELEKIRNNLRPLLEVCKKHSTAIRIGVNHGSLSNRIMSRYGDTPMGMVVSLMEFIRICKEEHFENLVLSIKASNTRIMVQACRLLSNMMQSEGMLFPIHLGVTEAGDAEDGRIKSAVGIGALLFDGIGDTIRVSLTENPEVEIPVAHKIVQHSTTQKGIETLSRQISPFDPYQYSRRETNLVGEKGGVGGNKMPVVIADARHTPFDGQSPLPDYVLVSNYDSHISANVTQIVPLLQWKASDGTFPLIDFDQISEINTAIVFVRCTANQIINAKKLELPANAILLLETSGDESFYHQRAALFALIDQKCAAPVILSRTYNESDLEWLQVRSAADFGALFIDGLGDGILLSNKNNVISASQQRSIAFGILQAARVRYSKTEYISCPSCGRTLFDIQNTVREIKQRTNHLKGLKIGIMGCIVNGPGEMADADYGYVGAGRGKITLYKGKTVQQANISAELAVDALIELIKSNNDWQDPQ